MVGPSVKEKRLCACLAKVQDCRKRYSGNPFNGGTYLDVLFAGFKTGRQNVLQLNFHLVVGHRSFEVGREASSRLDGRLKMKGPFCEEKRRVSRVSNVGKRKDKTTKCGMEG